MRHGESGGDALLYHDHPDQVSASAVAGTAEGRALQTGGERHSGGGYDRSRFAAPTSPTIARRPGCKGR